MKYSWLLAAMKGTSWGKRLSLAKKYLLDRKNIDPITKCALCPNNCRFSCPIALIDAKETTSPAGKARIAFLLKNGYIEWREDSIYPIFYCLGCELCKPFCPFGFAQTELLATLRKEAIDRGVAPKTIIEYTKNFRITRINTGYEATPRKTLIYLGQQISDRTLIDKLFNLLESLGLEPYILEEEIAIDLKPYYLGLTDQTKELAEQVYDLIKQAKQIVTPSAKTYYFLEKVIPNAIKKKVKAKHIIDIIGEHKNKIRTTTDEQFVLHENALLLSIKNNEAHQREILRELKINFILPPRNGYTTIPCPTQDNMLYMVDKKLAERICERRIRELKELNRTVLTIAIEDNTISRYLPTKNIITILETI